MTTPTESSRRDFLKTAALSAGAVSLVSRSARAANDAAPLKVGLVGCGKRGTGAAKNCIDSADNVTITAMGDLMHGAMADARKKFSSLGDAFKATEDTCFVGWDAYQKVIDSGVDIVLLCTPPHFRHIHLSAAIKAGKHVFMEKPAAVDPVGVRAIIAAGEVAKKKNLSIVAGTQRRHQKPYIDTIARIHGGDIGEIVSAQCYWIGDYDYYPGLPHKDGWSDVEWQIRNWNYFTWLSGDHIVEQHVHNIDVINWALQGHPLKAIGLGGRQQRTGPEFGHIFDHFAVEFEYPNGVRVQSYCRQQKDCASRVTEYITGTAGASEPGKGIQKGKVFKAENGRDPYVQEHADLIAAIRTGKPINCARDVAESTMAAIMGRMACYTGQEVTWDFAMNHSKENLAPAKYEFGPLPVPPVAVPGVNKLI